jgi:hypothetical protein
MSNAFTNFLSGIASGIFDSGADLKDFQHADRLYVKDTYARSPKVGFLYYIIFEVNQSATKNDQWLQRGKPNIGLLVKRIDLPKFSITVEELNQYNRKTLVQTKIKYQPVSIDFHDDNSNITTNLWKSYYQYYYKDSNYGKTQRENIEAYGDTKYGLKYYNYGLANYQKDPFFKKIDIFVLHQGNYSQYTLINPLVNEWTHDSLDQAEGGKILSNRMTVNYENVIYNTEQKNKINKSKPENFGKFHYDQTPSPLGVGGKGSATIFGQGGIISGVDSVFGTLASAKSPLDFLGAAIQANQVAKNIKQLSKAGLQQEGYSILKGVLGNIQSSGNQPGSVGGEIRTAINNGNFGTLGNIGLGLFKNATVDKTQTANLKNLNNPEP